MKKLSRVGVNPLPKLHDLKQKFDDLPSVKFSMSLPQTVAGALEGAEDIETRLIGEIADELGGSSEDYRVARRIRKLQKAGVGNGVTSGTIPELLVYDFLQQEGHQFLFQPEIDGGRTRAGGVVPDFAVMDGGRWTVFLVNGVYWHNRAAVSNSDVTDKVTILAATIQGLPVARVIELWDKTLYAARKKTITYGLNGIELGY